MTALCQSFQHRYPRTVPCDFGTTILERNGQQLTRIVSSQPAIKVRILIGRCCVVRLSYYLCCIGLDVILQLIENSAAIRILPQKLILYYVEQPRRGQESSSEKAASAAQCTVLCRLCVHRAPSNCPQQRAPEARHSEGWSMCQASGALCCTRLQIC